MAKKSDKKSKLPPVVSGSPAVPASEVAAIDPAIDPAIDDAADGGEAAPESLGALGGMGSEEGHGLHGQDTDGTPAAGTPTGDDAVETIAVDLSAPEKTLVQDPPVRVDVPATGSPTLTITTGLPPDTEIKIVAHAANSTVEVLDVMLVEDEGDELAPIGLGTAPADAPALIVLSEQEQEFPDEVQRRLIDIDTALAAMDSVETVKLWRDQPVREMETIKAELDAAKAAAAKKIAALEDEVNSRFAIAQRLYGDRARLNEKRRGVVTEYLRSVESHRQFRPVRVAPLGSEKGLQ